MGEMAAIFNNTKYFHIGCDETSAASFAGIPGYAEFVKAHNISSPQDAFAYYVQQLVSFAHELGRTPILWTGGDTSRLRRTDAVIQVWEQGSQAYIDQGFRVLNSPGMGTSAHDGWVGNYEYLRNLTDFGGTDHANTNATTEGLIIGAVSLLWETGFARGKRCYYGSPCTPFLDIMVGKAAGQLWYGRTLPQKRPDNETAWFNVQSSWGSLGRLSGQRAQGGHCDGPDALQSCLSPTDLAVQNGGSLPTWFSSSRVQSHLDHIIT